MLLQGWPQLKILSLGTSWRTWVLGYFQGEERKLLHGLSIIKPDSFKITSFNHLLFTACLIWILIYKGLVFCLVRFLISKPVCEVDQEDSSETKITPSFYQQWKEIKQHSWPLLSNLCPYIHWGPKRRSLWYKSIRYDKIFDKELYQENPRTTLGVYVKIFLSKTYISQEKLKKSQVVKQTRR